MNIKPLSLVTAVALSSVAVAACDHPSKTGAAPSSTTAVVTTAPATTPTPSTPAQTADNSSPNAPVTSTTTSTATTSSTAATGPASANAVTDTIVTGKVKTAITADNGMKDSDISVKTENGLVTLTGTVKSQEQVTLAAALAQRQEGVNRVENQITVK